MGFPSLPTPKIGVSIGSNACVRRDQPKFWVVYGVAPEQDFLLWTTGIPGFIRSSQGQRRGRHRHSSAASAASRVPAKPIMFAASTAAPWSGNRAVQYRPLVSLAARAAAAFRRFATALVGSRSCARAHLAQRPNTTPTPWTSPACRLVGWAGSRQQAQQRVMIAWQWFVGGRLRAESRNYARAGLADSSATKNQSISIKPASSASSSVAPSMAAPLVSGR